jgi:hypothetical protein
MIASENEYGLALELAEDFHAPIDLGFGDGGFIEQVAGDHDEVSSALVGGGDQTLERSKALVDQALSSKRWIFAEGKAEVIIGGM